VVARQPAGWLGIRFSYTQLTGGAIYGLMARICSMSSGSASVTAGWNSIRDCLLRFAKPRSLPSPPIHARRHQTESHVLSIIDNMVRPAIGKMPTPIRADC